MAQPWEGRPWRHWTIEYMNTKGDIITQTILARDMGEAITLMEGWLRPGMTVAPGPYAEREPT